MPYQVWILVAAAFLIGLLVQGSGDRRAAESHIAEQTVPSTVDWWTCSMHPHIKLPEPGQCPICFMDLILEDTDELQTDDIPGTLATIAGYLDTEIAAILLDTGTTIPGLIAALNNLDLATILGTRPGSRVLRLTRTATVPTSPLAQRGSSNVSKMVLSTVVLPVLVLRSDNPVCRNRRC